jgi:hypothetical protein
MIIKRINASLIFSHLKGHPMLSDFLTLEYYFGYDGSAQFLEDLSRKYGIDPVKKALKDGDLERRQIALGPDRGRFLVWLSEKARQRLKGGLYAKAKTC